MSTFRNTEGEEILSADASAGAAIDRPTLSARIRSTWHLWLPLLLMAVLILPRLSYLLPATTDLTDEVYQPLRTLKFFKSRGQMFHKYGPMPNLILAGPYAVTMAYWYLTGDFRAPKEDFPYGFKHPLQQMGLLTFEGRFLMTAIAVVCFYFLAREVSRHVKNKLAVALALTFCIAANATAVWKVPVPEVDSPMLAFSAAALAVYMRMLFDGVTPRRGFWFAAFAVAAFSSKEIAGPVFALPVLALGIAGWIRSRNDPAQRRLFLRSAGIAILDAIAVYGMLSVVYAPHVWVKRMNHWLFGPGVDSDVWGSSTGWFRIKAMAIALVNNLGPGGAVACILLVLSLIWLRPRINFLLLLLPSLGAFLVVSQIGYVPSRFYTPTVLCLMPCVAIALDRLLDATSHNRALVALLVVLAGANFWFATITWVKLQQNPQRLAEQYALSHLTKSEKVATFAIWPIDPKSSRFDYLGFKVEGRPVQKWLDGSSRPPRVAFVVGERYQYVTEARKMPGRAKVLLQENDFDVNKWPGLEAMGYSRAARFNWHLPAWCPFNWIPLGDMAEHKLLVYEYNKPPSQPATLP